MKLIRTVGFLFLLAGCGPLSLKGAHSAHSTVLTMGQSNMGMFLDNEEGALAKGLGTPTSFVRCEVGGTEIKRWLPDGDLYKACLTHLNGTHVDMVLWWQGEQDSLGTSETNKWGQDFSQIIQHLRQDTHSATLPVYYVRLGDIDVTTVCPYWDTIRLQQSGGFGPNVFEVNIDGILSKGIDNVHYDASGYDQVLGRLLSVIHEGPTN